MINKRETKKEETVKIHENRLMFVSAPRPGQGPGNTPDREPTSSPKERQTGLGESTPEEMARASMIGVKEALIKELEEGREQRERTPDDAEKESMEREAVVEESRGERGTVRGQLPSIEEVKAITEVDLPEDTNVPSKDTEIREFLTASETENIGRRIAQMDLLPIFQRYEQNRRTIDIDAWDTSSEMGLKRIYRDLELAYGGPGIFNNHKKQTFAVLRHAIENPEYTQSEPGKSLHAAALRNIEFIKQQVFHKQNVDRLAIEATKEGLDTGKINNFIRSNWEALSRAWRNRDYASLALTAGVGYVLYRAVSSLWEKRGQEGDKGMLGRGLGYLAVAAAGVVAVDALSKNAGTGFRPLRALEREVSGARRTVENSSLSLLGRAIEEVNELSEKEKKLDGEILIRMSEVRLTSLERLRTESSAEKFIDPRNFRSLLRGRIEGLDPSSKEYRKVGEELYKIANALRAAYGETIGKHHVLYRNRSYEEALSREEWRNANVRYFMAAINPFIRPRTEPEGSEEGQDQ